MCNDIKKRIDLLFTASFVVFVREQYIIRLGCRQSKIVHAKILATTTPQKKKEIQKTHFNSVTENVDPRCKSQTYESLIHKSNGT